MFGWMQRQKLVREGRACDRTRRLRSEAEWKEFLETSHGVRAGICLILGLLLAACAYWSFSPCSNETILLLVIVYCYGLLIISLDLPEIWRSNSKLLLIVLCIAINLGITRGLYLFSQHQQSATSTLVYLVPTAFAPMVLSVLLGTRVGLYAVILDSLIDSILLTQTFSLLMINLITGFTAVFFTRKVRRRSDLIRAGMATGLASLLCALVVGTVNDQAPLQTLFQQAAMGITCGIVTAMVVNSILPVLEGLFGVTPDISWVEMADLNHPLLRQLTLEAPGTYHHSLMVANLAEAGAEAIGANSTQCRVIAYFHDIGKMPKAEYFTENIPSGENPHEDLSPSMSALIIISHVKEGVDLAIKHRLKKPIIDAIQQHHGDSLVYFFYKRAKQLEEDAIAGGKILHMREEDIPEVSENSFRYPGPRPQTREIGILALADAIEGASRSLDRPTPQKIESLVNEMVDRKMLDHQLDDCPLSLHDINCLKESFTLTLKSMLHGRISYPKDDRFNPSQSSARRAPAS